jgi:hypothetical protein
MTFAIANQAEIKWNGTVLGLARDISLSISKDALETTTLANRDRTYVGGLRGATGTCSLLFDDTDTLVASLLNRITGNASTTEDGSLTFNFAADGARFILPVLITSVGMTASSGDLVTAEVEFQVTGPLPTGGF